MGTLNAWSSKEVLRLFSFWPLDLNPPGTATVLLHVELIVDTRRLCRLGVASIDICRSMRLQACRVHECRRSTPRVIRLLRCPEDLGNWRLQGRNKEAAEYVQKLLDTAKKTKPHPDYKKDKSMDMYYILHKMVEGQKTDSE